MIKHKGRQSNFELLRIVAMAMIVVSHCIYFGVMNVGGGDAYRLWNTGGDLFKILSSSLILGNIGVGIFFMISGYFLAHKTQISIKKVCAITIFYAVVVFVSFFAMYINGCLYESFGQFVLDMSSLIIVPLTGSVWWFVTAYIFLMLIAPCYNKFLDKLSRKGMIIFGCFLLVFGQTFGNLGSNFHDIEKAVFFYTIGVYFRDYIICSNENRIIFVVISLLGIIINGICQYGIGINMTNDAASALFFRRAFSMFDHFVAEPLSCVGVFGLCFCFCFYNSRVNWIARKTFGIYLLHESPLMRKFLWFHLFKPYEYASDGLYFYVYIIYCVLAVFMMGIIVDMIREKFLEKIYTNYIDIFIGKMTVVMSK